MTPNRMWRAQKRRDRAARRRTEAVLALRKALRETPQANVSDAFASYVYTLGDGNLQRVAGQWLPA